MKAKKLIITFEKKGKVSTLRVKPVNIISKNNLDDFMFELQRLIETYWVKK